MKIGIIKEDIAFPEPKTFLEKFKWRKMAKLILKSNPKYEQLRNNPSIKDTNDFQEAVTCAYLKDCILNNNPELVENYNEIVEENKKAYEEFEIFEDHTIENNYRFLHWYSDYLRDLDDPGVVEREREAHRQEMARLHAQHEAEERQAARQEQQDLAAGKRVVCPYCKSTNTEKISGVARGVSIYVMGIASPKIGKQWHCNNCKSDF